MGILQDYFMENKGRLIYKWMHYFDIYERHFERFVGKPINLMEIGVLHGGSLQMWRHYFGNKAMIYGVDIDARTAAFQDDHTRILLGDQGNPGFWSHIKSSLPVFDIIIDDGGHSMDQQRVTFEAMFPLLSSHGVYLVEDVHTSYWSEYGGGYQRSESFVEYSKHLIDKLNAWHSKDPRLSVDSFTESAWSISYYDSIIVIEKRPRERPLPAASGTPSW